MQIVAKDVNHSDHHHKTFYRSSKEVLSQDVFQKTSTMSNLWSAVVFLFNIWTLITTLLWASLHEMPTNIGLLFHILIEWVLLLEIIVRILVKSLLPDANDSLNLQHMEKRDSVWIYCTVLAGSFPMMTLYAAINNHDEVSDKTSVVARVLLIKLLRSFEIRRTIIKVEEILFYKKFKTLVFVKFIENLMIIIFVTHLFTCAWLFVQSSIINHCVIDNGQNPGNPYNTNKAYFQRTNEVDASLTLRYMDACLWAVSTLTACSFGDVTPRTLEEVILSLITLLAGVVLLAMIFSDFASLMNLLDIERAQAKKELQQALKLSEILGIPFKIRYKIQSFYARDTKAFSQTQYLPAVRDLPRSLHTDTVLSLNKDLIGTVNLFNFGSPELLINISRMFYPKVSMPGDYVLRAGDYAEEMFFIKQGEVEILATDKKTRIAILREGAYFGEIGLLLTKKRTVSVRALSVCVFEVVSKQDFDTIMEKHPEQKKLLLQVANQRVRTCSPEDLKLVSSVNNISKAEISRPLFTAEGDGRELDNRSSFSKKGHPFRARTIRGALRELKDRIVNRFYDYACMNKEHDFRNLSRLVILPTSKFYYLWAVILGLVVFANQIIIPYEISFGTEHEAMPTYWRTIDVIVVVIHFIDIFVHMNTTTKENGTYITDKSLILRNYFNNYFVLDLLAFLPIDYLMMALNLPASYNHWVKIIRFLKTFRMTSILFDLREYTEKKDNAFLLVILAFLHTSLNHIAACIMHMIASSEYENSVGDTLISNLNKKNLLTTSLANEPPSVQYVYFSYWAYTVSSAGSYGDISGVTPSEKIFEAFTLVFFRVFFTFIAAEVARIFTSAYVSFKENLDKKTMYDSWMNHIKLPLKVITRVKSFNEHIFTKYKGLDENQILSQLPATTRDEIFEFLLTDMLETIEIFPKNEPGLYSNLIRSLRIQIVTKEEDIFRAGETAEEIYFIVEGDVVIKGDQDQKRVAHLRKNDFFGEMAIMDGQIGVRTKTATAKSNVTLAILHLNQLREIWDKYPSVKEKVIRVNSNGLICKKMDDTVSKRKKKNEKNKQINGNASERLLRDLETEAKAAEDLTKHDLNPLHNDHAIIPEFDQLRRELELSNDFNRPQSSKMLLEGLKRPEAGSINSTDKIEGENGQPLLKKINLEMSQKEPGSHTFLDNSIAKPKTPPKRQSNAEGNHGDHLDYIPESDLDHESVSAGSPKQQHHTGHSHHDVGSKKSVNDLSKIARAVEHTKKGLFRFEMRFKEIRPLILNLILFFDVMFAPLNIALEVATTGPMVYVEITFASILFFNFLLNLKDLILHRKDPKKVFLGALALAAIAPKSPQRKRGHRTVLEKHGHHGEHGEHGEHEEHGHGGHHEHHVTITTVCLDFIFMIPFTVIFHAFHVPGASTNVFLIAIQFVKLFAVEHLTWIFQREFFKKHYALNNIVLILYAFVILNHFFACIFIILANARHDPNNTWYAKVPAPQFDFPNPAREPFDYEQEKLSVYCHALYWSYMTTSHIGVGDVSAVNNGERIYSSIVIMISTFIYAFLFGNLTSMVEDLTPKFQKEFEKNYRSVLEYVKDSNLDIFIDKIHKYYNYIWQDSKGVDENALVSRLPNSLQYDIFLSRYEVVIKNSNFFKNPNGQFNPNIFFSFCKKFRYGVFMENDMIVTLGQDVTDVYVILEGEAEVTNLKDTKLGPGDHLGGIIPNMIQLQSVKATKITKVAILSQEAFLQLRDAYPEWYEYIKKFETISKVLSKCARMIKQRIQERKDKALGKPVSRAGTRDRTVAPARKRPTIVEEQPEEQKSEENLNLLKLVQVEEAGPKTPFDQRKRDISRKKISTQPSSQTAFGSSESNHQKKTSTLLNPDSIDVGSKQPTPDPNRLPDGDMEPLGEHGLIVDGTKNNWIELAEALDSPKGDHGVHAKIVEENIPKLNLSSSQSKKRRSPSQGSYISGKAPNSSLHSPSDMKEAEDVRIPIKNTEDVEQEEEIVKGGWSPDKEKKGYLSFAFNKGAKTPQKHERSPSEGKNTENKFWGKKGSPSKPLVRSNQISPTPQNRKSLLGSLLPGFSPKKIPQNMHQDSQLQPPSFMEEQYMTDSRQQESPKLPDKKKNTDKTKGFALAEVILEKKKLADHMKSLKYYINPNSKAKIAYELIHTLVIIYSVYMIPLTVGFNIELNWALLLIEFLILIELIAYPICLMRTAQYNFGLLTLQSKQVWRNFREKGFYTYVTATLPINLLFSLCGINPPLWVAGILRLNRVFLIVKVSAQFAFFGSKYPQITRLLTIVKPTFYLVFVSHFISCLFSFVILVEPTDKFSFTFMEYLELAHAPLSTRYMVALDFMLSIITTTGYPELIVYNDYERLMLIFFIYGGDAVYALIMGWYTANSTSLPEKYQYVFQKILKMDYVLEQSRLPHKIRNKIENYFAYIVSTRNSNKSCLQSLSGLLPHTTLKDMAYEQAKTFQRFPLFKQFKNKILIKEIIQNLKQNIYLPHDYIITKDEIGSEMYCIAEGSVYMLSPNEKKILAVLETGAFFGELGVYTKTKRLTSFVAADFCLIYILDQEVLKKILKKFPRAESEFEVFVQEKLTEKKSKDNHINQAVNLLHAIGNLAESTVDHTQELLNHAEIPVSLLGAYEKAKRAEIMQSVVDNRGNINPDKLDTESSDEEQNLVLDTLTADDFVEDEELNHRGIDMKKTSFRVKTRRRERRFSRVQMGKEKSVSKAYGLTIKWGINLQ